MALEMDDYNPLIDDNSNVWNDAPIHIVRDATGLIVQIQKTVQIWDGTFRTYTKTITRTDCAITDISSWAFTC